MGGPSKASASAAASFCLLRPNCSGLQRLEPAFVSETRTPGERRSLSKRTWEFQWSGWGDPGGGTQVTASTPVSGTLLKGGTVGFKKCLVWFFGKKQPIRNCGSVNLMIYRADNQLNYLEDFGDACPWRRHRVSQNNKHVRIHLRLTLLLGGCLEILFRSGAPEFWQDVDHAFRFWLFQPQKHKGSVLSFNSCQRGSPQWCRSLGWCD